MAGRTVIIDGYNFIGSVSTLERSRLETRREALALRADHYAAARRHRVTVVFDGADGGERPGGRLPRSRAEVVFTTGDKADAWIVAEVRRLRGQCVVVTDDRPLSHACEREGAVVVRCRWFDSAMRRAAAEVLAGRETQPRPARDANVGALSPRPLDDDAAWRAFAGAGGAEADPALVAAMMDVPDEVAAARASDGEEEDPASEAGVTREERQRRNVLADL